MSNNFTKSKSAKAIAGFVGLTTGLMMVGGVALSVSAASVSELTAQINSLLAQITSLQSQLGTLQGGSTTNTTTTTTTASGYTFTSNLKKGDKGEDVLQLQKLLNSDTDTQVATTGVGSKGNETNYFGGLTKAAVIKFQNKYKAEILTPVGLTVGTGYVGPSTRAKLNAMTAVVTPAPAPAPTTTTTTTTTTGGTTSGVVTTGTGFTVTAGTQPANSLAVGGAARVPFTTFTVTNNSNSVQTLKSVTVERSGLVNKAVFSGIVLLDGNGKQLGNSKTLNSNYQATIGENVSFQPGQSMTFTVAGNMNSSLSGYSGQVGGLNVIAISTGATVTGTFPIIGSQQTMNGNLTIGTATVGTPTTVSNPNDSSQPIGTNNYVFSAIRVTAGSAEDITVKGIRFNQSGSASSADLSNVSVYVGGTAYPTTVSSDGKYYSATFGSGIVINKGFSKDIYIKGDITGTGAASRTVQFDIYKNTDLYIVGNTYGYGITATGNLTSSTPSWTGSVLTVTAGSVTSIAKDTTVPAQNIAVNVPSQVLGGFTTNIKGEPITVQTMVFTVASTSGSGTGLLTNVSLYDQNGAVVAGPVDATYTSTLVQTLTFTDSITLPVGKQAYVLKGKVASTIGTGTQYTTTVDISNWSNITGDTTGNTISLGVSNFALNPVTVKAGALAITKASTPATQTIVAGGQQVPFITLQLDASLSGEDLQFSKITLGMGGTGQPTPNTCQLYDGGTALNTGSNVPTISLTSSTTVAFTLDNALTIPKGTIKSLTVKCNVPSTATGTYNWSMTPSSTNPSLTGVTSGSSITATGSAITGNTMTIGTGKLVFSIGASSPSYGVATAGTTGVVAGVYKLRPSNDNITLTKLGLQLTNDTVASSTASDLTNVSLWANGIQIGSAVFTGGNTTATSTLNNGGIVLTKDVDTLITVKADLANIGTGQAVTNSGDLVKIDYLNAEGIGVGSGSTIYGSGSTAVSGIRVFKSAPTVALDTLSSAGVADGKLLRFKVTADAKGSIGLDQFKFTLATSTLTSVTGINMFGYTDASYSNAISGVGTGGQVATNDTTAPTGTFTITPSSIIQVPAGQTYYFEVRGTVAGTQTGSSVTTKLLGDSAYPSLASGVMMGTATALLSGENLVWSPNSTTTSVAADLDWSNGYGVNGLPSSGISQTRGL